MRTAYALCKDYPAPVAAILALTLLFGVALFRLAQVHQDLRENVGTNMYWVVSQSQIESLRLSNALRGKVLNPASRPDVHLQYQLLLSRLNILRDGPQERYLEEKGIAGELAAQFTEIEALAPLFEPDAPITRETLAQTEPTLRRFTSTMAEAAADAMAHQW